MDIPLDRGENDLPFPCSALLRSGKEVGGEVVKTPFHSLGTGKKLGKEKFAPAVTLTHFDNRGDHESVDDPLGISVPF